MAGCRSRRYELWRHSTNGPIRSQPGLSCSQWEAEFFPASQARSACRPPAPLQPQPSVVSLVPNSLSYRSQTHATIVSHPPATFQCQNSDFSSKYYHLPINNCSPDHWGMYFSVAVTRIGYKSWCLEDVSLAQLGKPCNTNSPSLLFIDEETNATPWRSWIAANLSSR